MVINNRTLRAHYLAEALCLVSVCVSLAAAQTSGEAGTLTDQRDGKVYRTAKIGKQIWMTENIDIETGSSWCYDGDTSNCNAYGRLYDRITAKTACPAGWRLPSFKEWGIFVKTVSDQEAAAKKRNATKEPDEEWSNTNVSRLPAILGGGRYHIGGDYKGIGGISYWWAATESADRYAYYRYVNYGHDIGNDDFDAGEYGFSVRCVMNDVPPGKRTVR